MMFYIRDTQGNKQGPLSAVEIKQMARNGIILPDTMIISQNGREVSADKYPGLFDQTPPVNVPQTPPIQDSKGNTDSESYEHPPEPAATVAVPVSAVAIHQAGNQGTLEQQIAMLSMTIKRAMLLMKMTLGLLGTIILFQIINILVQTGQIGFLKQMNNQQKINFEVQAGQIGYLKQINAQQKTNFEEIHLQLKKINTQKYEYKIVAPRDSVFEEKMNEYGQQGWELISARRATGDYSVSYECILKRPLR
jgi:hypothetical protein